MNPWHLLRREIDGAVRSVRYDLAVRRARRGMNEATTELPVITATPPLTGDAGRKRRVILATSSVLVAAGAVSGYYAVTSGLDALVADGGSPAGLPGTGARPVPSSSISPQVEPTATTPGAVRVPIAHSSVIPPRPTQTTAGPPTGTPPVPTPAPTCNCPTGTPSPSPSPSTSPTPSSTQPTATPTSTATP